MSDLEQEIARLRGLLDTAERMGKYDRISGLPNRGWFLERATAEFQRAKRYDHALAVVVVRLTDLESTRLRHGPDAADLQITGLAQICETACRAGVDITGRTTEDEVTIFLPETNLSGGLQFLDRLHRMLNDTPIQMNDRFVRLKVEIGVDGLLSDDVNFIQIMERAAHNLA